MNPETESLRRQLRDAQMALTDAESALEVQKLQTHQLLDSYKVRILDADEKLRRQRRERDVELRELTTQLVFFEDQLKNEQVAINKMVQVKDKVILEQQVKLQQLTGRNHELREAIREVKGQLPENESVSSSSTDSMDYTYPDCSTCSSQECVFTSTPRNIPMSAVSSLPSMQMEPDVMIPRYLECSREKPSRSRHLSGYQGSDSGVDETSSLAKRSRYPNSNLSQSLSMSLPDLLSESSDQSNTTSSIPARSDSFELLSSGRPNHQPKKLVSYTGDTSCIPTSSISSVPVQVTEILRETRGMRSASRSMPSSPSDHVKARARRPRDVKRKSAMRAKLALEREDSSSNDDDHYTKYFSYTF